MENPPEIRPSAHIRSAQVRCFIICGGVCAMLAIACGFLTDQSIRRHNQLVDNGLAHVEKLADVTALPLFEQDIKSLHGILRKTGDWHDVLYDSVIDHKNKIIAYNGAVRPLPEQAGQVQQYKGVDIGANPKLASVKDQMTRQRAEIIKRLAAKDPSAVRHAEEDPR